MRCCTCCSMKFWAIPSYCTCSISKTTQDRWLQIFLLTWAFLLCDVGVMFFRSSVSGGFCCLPISTSFGMVNFCCMQIIKTVFNFVSVVVDHMSRAIL
uniref:Uncharacterized protein n=1 Tax=Aegilops tauschii subsp. strangulata TaxID=200361 RepID=A0A452XJU7_AEGTS